MPIIKSKNPSSDLTVFTCEGQISAQEIINTMKRFYEGIDGPPTRWVLWDLSRADTKNVPVDEVDDIAQLRLENIIQMGGGKTAVVAPKDLDFGMARMLQAKAIGAPRHLMVFRTMDEAWDWMKMQSGETL